MTAEEAIEELKYSIGLIKQNGKDWLDERDIHVLEKAIEALEKCVAKKPIKHGPSELSLFYRCPICDNCLPDYFPRCIICGQKIDWSKITTTEED